MKVDDTGSLIIAREYVSGWAEWKLAARSPKAFTVAQFIYRSIVCRHGCPRKVVMDGGPENQGEVKSLLADLGVRAVTISAYHL